MRLNMDILAAWLPKQWRVKCVGASSRDLTLSRPRLYEPGVFLLADNLYLASTQSLPAQPPEVSCSFVCVGRRLPSAWLAAGFPVLQLFDTVSLAEVYNRIQEIYDRFDDWDAQLRDELEKDAEFDIRQVLLLGAGFLRRSVNVVDSNLQKLFSAEYDDQTGAKIVAQSGPMPPEHRERIKEVCNLERVIREPYQTAMNSFGHAYCKNLYVSDQFCGCISITETENSFQPWEFPAIAHFFFCFQKAYSIYLRSSARQEDAAISSLRRALSGRTLTEDDQRELSLAEGEAWILFELRERKNERAFPPDYMYATLNATFPRNVYSVIYHEKIVGLLRVRHQRSKTQTDFTAFSECISKMGYYAGMSNAFSSLSLIQDHLRQASYVLGQDDAQPSALRFFRDHTLSYMLDCCITEQPADSLLTEGLRALILHDQQKGSEYIHTLDLYLQNETSVARTAEALYIHRSSLLKRLDKIYQILGHDLDTPNERLYLRMCLSLLHRQNHHF